MTTPSFIEEKNVEINLSCLAQLRLHLILYVDQM